MQPAIDIAELARRTGTEIGVSRWFQLDQPKVDAFADLTEDHQFIHVDPARAATDSPFGGTIAHGFLTLSLLTAMSLDVLPGIQNTAVSINYGFDRVRFLSPVPAGSRIRGRFTLSDLTDKGRNQHLATYAVTVEAEGAARPALAADWLILTVLK
ncbi:MaoC family dehydratase [Caenispirillum bisanense]|uniref:Nodulation protein NolN n=1 Tax=Caenispirillum bisanense TaxID=414052 RepID=A0A286GWN3_9PROT|nr:MaoC family dehydratase [Caenispirillum bisanense]SOD99911.1 nodulation protein NolN [Caenispirillum bisanense]